MNILNYIHKYVCICSLSEDLPLRLTMLPRRTLDEQKPEHQVPETSSGVFGEGSPSDSPINIGDFYCPWVTGKEGCDDVIVLQLKTCLKFLHGVWV